MIIQLSLMLEIVRTCAPGVAAETMLAVAHAESRFDSLAIGVNDGPAARGPFPTKGAAVKVARRLIAEGRSVDLGLGQINSRNLSWLGLSIEDAFDPCLNLNASARVLQSAYDAAAPGRAGSQDRLHEALSRYNTGHPVRGLRNGYVDRVQASAHRLSPALSIAAQAALRPVASTSVTQRADQATVDVFARPGSRTALVFDPAARIGALTEKNQ